jgi:hypothetical protein
VKLTGPAILLCLVAFLAPIIGGQLSLEALGITDPSQVLGSVFGGPEAPLLAHSVLAALVGAALAAVLISRRIIQVPTNWISGTLVLFLAVATASVAYSDFKSISMIAAFEWLT